MTTRSITEAKSSKVEGADVRHEFSLDHPRHFMVAGSPRTEQRVDLVDKDLQRGEKDPISDISRD